MGSHRSRRGVLAIGTTVIAGAFGGCSAITSGIKTKGEEREPRLCKEFRLANYDTQPHVIHTLIRRDDEIVRWWTSEEIPPEHVSVVELDDWRETRGDYVVYGSYDEYPEWSFEDYSDVTLEENVVCLVGAVEIREGGDVDVVFYPKGEGDFQNGTANARPSIS